MTRSLPSEIEIHLRRARRRGNALRLLGDLALLGIGALVAVLGGAALWARGWVDGLAAWLFVAISLAVLGFAAILVSAWRLGGVPGSDASAERHLARRLDDAHPTMMDRLVTWVHLRQRPESAPANFAARVEHQAERELLFAPSPFEAETRRLRRHLLVLVLAIVLGGVFALEILPDWARTHAWNEQIARAPRVEMPGAFDLESPLADAAEIGGGRGPWAEVRITEPGRDLEVTKVDVVPLRIEAASSEPMAEARWRVAKTGEEPDARSLDLPTSATGEGEETAVDTEEGHWAVLRPSLYVDELYLSDWDVVSYWAEVDTEAGGHLSEVYFLEVRPFRSEIEKATGGEGSEGYRGLAELTGLIDRQKHVLRQTHRHLATASRLRPEQRAADRAKLVAAEDDLRRAAEMLYAEIAGMDHLPTGAILDHLARAGEHLETAVEALEQAPSNALEPEQSALAELVATRKAFSKAISENPSSSQGEGGEDREPTAELPKQLDEIAEYRDADRAARELVSRLAEEQRRLVGELDAGGPIDPEAQAAEQERARRELERFAEQNPSVFPDDDPDGLGATRREAERHLERSAEFLPQPEDREAARLSTQRAAESLERLGEALEKRGDRRQLQDLERLRRMMEEQADRLGEMSERASEDGAPSPEERASAADAAERVAEAMAEAVRGDTGREMLEDPVRDATEEDDLDALRRAMDELRTASTGGACRNAASSGQGALSGMASAYDRSLPRATREARSNDPFAEGDGLEEAVSRLRSMARRAQDGEGEGEGEGVAISAEERREALEALRRSLAAAGERSEESSDDPRAALLAEAEELLDAEEAEPAPIDLERLRRLLDGIELMRLELARVDEEIDPGTLTGIDPEDLPAEYRERIQRYLVELSERSR